MARTVTGYTNPNPNIRSTKEFTVDETGGPDVVGTNPMTTVGDLIVGGASGTPTRLANLGTGTFDLKSADGVVGWGTESGGASVPTITTVTANTTLSTYDTTLVDTTGGPITITLGTMAAGTIRIVKNIGTDTVTVTGTVDGATPTLLTAQYQSLTLQSVGSTWVLI